MDGELSELARECQPELRDSAFLLASHYPALRFLEAHNSSSSLACSLCGTDVDARGSFPLELHALRHLPPESQALFQCHLCRYTGPDIIGHTLAQHDHGWWLRCGVGPSFSDERAERSDELLLLFQRCFPAPISLPPDPPELKATPQRKYPAVPRSARKSADAKPQRFLGLAALLVARLQDGSVPPRCAECGSEFKITRGQSSYYHPQSHVRTPLFQCRICGLRERSKSGKHAETHGLSVVEAFEDRRAEAEPELLRAFRASFPALFHFSVWYPGLANLALATELGRLASGQPCQLCEQRPALDRMTESDGELAAASHVFGHWEQPLFSCILCRYSGPLIWEHLFQRHGRWPHSSTPSRPLFEERVSENDDALVALLKRCFD